MTEVRRRRTLTAALAAAFLGGCAVTAQPPGSPVETTAPASAASTSALPAPSVGPDVEIRTAALGAASAAPALPPSRVVYERLGIDMPVDPVGVTADGAMEIPPDAARSGWYRFGPGVAPESGTAVVAAHAGSVATPHGPFYDLRDAAPGDRVQVSAADGRAGTYEVVAVERLAKATLDLTPYFRRDGEPRLVLATCGGEWDEARRSYDDNIIVTAILVEG
ncbi:class F sortase [Georgenia yuyongxinii]|uniref:Class F sortase n=1 Tax=Georgenia yuyongxinii TaxID=2589797 RepID=A0A552WRY6_9MICO|nr:class F sortase [Georgenia yuyongxinii]TRW45476.1 class F sortase [Georgenia yuyongxinii]